ncbi:hypothetical protein KCP69_18520 [Salmonella enterica subsp. enterica]|nr:hypothetical protein KCP69_18520 [Salmonella enterica subsp. enterica]
MGATPFDQVFTWGCIISHCSAVPHPLRPAKSLSNSATCADRTGRRWIPQRTRPAARKIQRRRPGGNPAPAH